MTSHCSQYQHASRSLRDIITDEDSLMTKLVSSFQETFRVVLIQGALMPGMLMSSNIDYLKPLKVLFENKLDWRPAGKTNYDGDIGPEDWAISRFLCSCKSVQL